MFLIINKFLFLKNIYHIFFYEKITLDIVMYRLINFIIIVVIVTY